MLRFDIASSINKYESIESSENARPNRGIKKHFIKVILRMTNKTFEKLQLSGHSLAKWNPFEIDRVCKLFTKPLSLFFLLDAQSCQLWMFLLATRKPGTSHPMLKIMSPVKLANLIPQLTRINSMFIIYIYIYSDFPCSFFQDWICFPVMMRWQSHFIGIQFEPEQSNAWPTATTADKNLTWDATHWLASKVQFYVENVRLWQSLS